MTYRGQVRNGKIELDGSIGLPEGTHIELTIVSGSRTAGNGHDSAAHELSLDQELDRIWRDVPESEWKNLPPDLTDQLDHYLYGTPKR